MTTYALSLRNVPLSWHRATEQDGPALSVFRCTTPESSRFNEETEEEEHDFPWEFEVQDAFNTRRIPVYPPAFILLGHDEQGLAAALSFKVLHFDRYGYIELLGVHPRGWRRGYASDALRQAHELMALHDVRNDYAIQARVDRDNIAAQDFFQNAGFITDDRLERARYQTWALQVL